MSNAVSIDVDRSAAETAPPDGESRRCEQLLGASSHCRTPVNEADNAMDARPMTLVVALRLHLNLHLTN
jgi:hypothetical protein